MLVVLGMPTSLCGTFAGEAGRVIQALISDEGIRASSIAAPGTNGVYIHDRRNGSRVPVAQMNADPLHRHELDEFYGRAFVEGIEADVCLLAGPSEADILPSSIYERLAGDLTANQKVVVADLSGDELKAVIAGGVAVLKVSEEELLAGGWVTDTSLPTVADAMRTLASSGAANVVVSRAERHAVALLQDGRFVEATGPTLQPVDARGAGDSMTAGIAASLARGCTIEDGLRLGVAAGSLNVTRRGLATGNRGDIERLAKHVTVQRVEIA
jgi:1-phosphofructokinase